MRTIATLLLVLMPLSGCAIFDTIPEPVKDGARHAAAFSQINEANISYINNEWHKVLVMVINDHTNLPEEQKTAMKKAADALKIMVERRTQVAAQLNRELSTAVSAYLDEPGIGLNRIIELLSTATKVLSKVD